MPVPHCSFVPSFEIGKCKCSSFVLFQYCFGYSGLLQFYMSLRSAFSFAQKEKKATGILIGIELGIKVVGLLDKCCYLKTLSPQICEHDVFPLI